VRDVDRAAVQHFVDWLIAQPGRKGRLSDRSVANALTPLRAVLGAAVADGLLAQTRSRAWCCRGVAAGARTSSRSGVS
jgi:Phage integrase SAM-like domain